ncbi:interleukin-2 receptor subunit beta isoform X2 [Lampris incognitus]|uniref:interleukin-2 receptor subunit beta isoform X2 n=1 Tax=Lampris incognitus TaxID=2546036 RepID=UPI0024B4B77C|nr:interleukin-2 receptor subunit beta isoform X2 [Lampris incognitus]
MAVAMQMLWTACALVVVLAGSRAVQTGTSPQGLSCVNDLLKNVNCTWSRPPVDPDEDCQVHGTRKTWVWNNGLHDGRPMIQSCKLEWLGNSVRGCSLVFETKNLIISEVMPSIQVVCNGVQMEKIANYTLYEHIKMHPPSAPNITFRNNETWISWTPGSPRSSYLSDFIFHVQIKQNHQSWKWSDWGAATSWMMDPKLTSTPEDEVSILAWLLGGISLGIFVLIPLLRVAHLHRGFLKKPVPDPSKYFHTLESVHRGNFKRWLNPQSTSKCFFMAQPHDHISPLEVYDASCVVPSPSPSSDPSTATLLHSHPNCLSSGLGESGSTDHSTSSCFSNMGYFYSSYTSSHSAGNPCPIYFTYQEDFHDPSNSHNLHITMCPSLTKYPSYQQPQVPGGHQEREPHSPDSGFGIGMDAQMAEEEERDEKKNGLKDSSICEDTPPLCLTIQLPFQISSSSPPPPPTSNSTSPLQVHPDNTSPVAGPSGSYVAWPLNGTIGRASSMPPGEPLTGGYLTLKELQTTYSNKSI